MVFLKIILMWDWICSFFWSTVFYSYRSNTHPCTETNIRFYVCSFSQNTHHTIISQILHIHTRSLSLGHCYHFRVHVSCFMVTAFISIFFFFFALHFELHYAAHFTCFKSTFLLISKSQPERVEVTKNWLAFLFLFFLTSSPHCCSSPWQPGFSQTRASGWCVIHYRKWRKAGEDLNHVTGSNGY